MSDNRTTELLRELRRTLEKCRRTEEAGFDTYWITAVALDTSLDELEQAIAATLGSGTHVYVLRGTDPNAMPSYGGETNELLAVYATREAAEKAKSEWRGYCDLNITEWEVA